MAGGKEIVLLFRDNSLLGEFLDRAGNQGRKRRTEKNVLPVGIKENSRLRYLGDCTRLEIKETEGRKGSSNYFSILLIGLVRSRFRDECLFLGSLLLPPLFHPTPSSPINRSRELTVFGIILFLFISVFRKEEERFRK